CNETVEPGHHFHARMFAPAMGVPEDPATGSAAAAFAGVLARRLSDGTHALTIEQGYEMGRPSLIHLTAEIAAGRLGSASIGGPCFPGPAAARPPASRGARSRRDTKPD